MSESSWGRVPEAAVHYQVSTDTIRRWVRAGIIAGRKVGPRLLLVELIDIAEFEGAA